MPIDLHPSSLPKLREALSGALKKLKVSDGIFIDYRTVPALSEPEAILPQNGKLHDRLVDYLDESPLTEFVLETIGYELQLRNAFRGGANHQLTDIGKYADTNALADRLLSGFQTLPWKYRISIPLPAALLPLVERLIPTVDLSDAVRLLRPTDDFEAEFPLATDNNRVNQQLLGPFGTGLFSVPGQTAKWERTILYVQISTEGFIGR